MTSECPLLAPPAHSLPSIVASLAWLSQHNKPSLPDSASGVRLMHVDGSAQLVSRWSKNASVGQCKGDMLTQGYPRKPLRAQSRLRLGWCKSLLHWPEGCKHDTMNVCTFFRSQWHWQTASMAADCWSTGLRGTGRG